MRIVRSLVPALVAAAGLAAPLAVVPAAQAAVTCGGLKATIVEMASTANISHCSHGAMGTPARASSPTTVADTPRNTR